MVTIACNIYLSRIYKVPTACYWPYNSVIEKKYKNGLVLFDEVKPLATKESITSIAKSSPAAKKVSREIRVYAEDDHLRKVEDSVKELYANMKSGILELDRDIEIDLGNMTLFSVATKDSLIL